MSTRSSVFFSFSVRTFRCLFAEVTAFFIGDSVKGWFVSSFQRVYNVSRSFFSFLSLLKVFSCFLFNCLQREIMGLRMVRFITEPFLPSFSTRHQNLFFQHYDCEREV